jgi:amicyanin
MRRAEQQSGCDHRQDVNRLIGWHMPTRTSHLRFAGTRLAVGRSVVVAMLCGPVIGAMLAFGAVAAQDVNVITIDNFTFSTKELTVSVGSTVRWINRDDIPHTIVAENAAFRSAPLDTDDVYSFTFTNAGTFDYLCGLHPLMTGKVIVK